MKVAWIIIKWLNRNQIILAVNLLTVKPFRTEFFKVFANIAWQHCRFSWTSREYNRNKGMKLRPARVRHQNLVLNIKWKLADDPFASECCFTSPAKMGSSVCVQPVKWTSPVPEGASSRGCRLRQCTAAVPRAFYLYHHDPRSFFLSTKLRQ